MTVRANLHVHSQRSDGSFSIDEIVSEAVRGGLHAVAITDHFETKKVRRCVTCAELDDYISEIREAQRTIDGRIKVLAGVEIDTNPDRCPLSDLPVDGLNNLDFVLFEYVNEEWNGGSTILDLAPLLSQIEVPCGLVHLDLERAFGGISAKDLANLLWSYNLFVEANTASPYQREGKQYYEHAERHFSAFKGKVQVSVGTDMHRTLSEVSNIGKGYEFLERLGLLDDLIVQQLL
jgi:histidinol phosphatase-like PHP family hydrolase